MDNAELEKRLAVFQDIEAIKRLKAEYCDICDDAHNQDRIVAIFAEDGIWEGKGSGGRKGTRTFGSWPRASLSASASHNTTSSIPASR